MKGLFVEDGRDFYTVAEVSRRLGRSIPYVIGLCKSGLLGYHEPNKIARNCVDQFEKFGTQWSGMKPRLADDGIHEIGDTQSALTHCEANIRTAGDHQPNGLEQINRFWIAQFYLTRNDFFFTPSTNLALTGNTGLRMERSKKVNLMGLEFCLYPDPNGFLAMVSSDVYPDKEESNYSTLRDKVSSIAYQLLSDISFKYDRSLMVNHEIYIGCPYGNIYFEFFKNGKRSPLDGYAPDEGLPLALVEAKRLYAEALSGSDVFQRFFQLYKSFEVATNFRNEIRLKIQGNKSDKRSDIFVADENIPVGFEYVPHEAKSFSSVFSLLRSDYRNALAHITEEKGDVKYMSIVKDRYSVWHSLPVIRYMAKSRIENVIATYRAHKDQLTF